MPKISVLMPVYNTCEAHLRQAIESILNQTFTDFEFLILNDASSDASVEPVIKSYDDPRIIYAANERNLGISSSRNKLMDMARGEYLAVMDHDDISLPERLEKEAAYLDAHPDVGLVCCQTGNIGNNKTTDMPLQDIELKQSLLIDCILVHPACMLRKTTLNMHGIRYEEFFSPNEDHALFCRMIPHTKFAALPEVLFLYRVWEGNTSHRKARQMEAAKYGIFDFARRENPELWAMSRLHIEEKTRIKLFDAIPLFSIRNAGRKKTIYLFDLIPLLSFKKRHPRFMNDSSAGMDSFHEGSVSE